ncbi:uncharacterized protein LOC135164261 isoform X3 [Diachasmimorpha longicaudata]|uniref:uncharacterized protein LOC135164261 isoform X3 n=2 Tax=Diachasmimorpha longicaudata TaxID=58733 RepID=UPI0030B90FD8
MMNVSISPKYKCVIFPRDKGCLKSIDGVPFKWIFYDPSIDKLFSCYPEIDINDRKKYEEFQQMVKNNEGPNKSWPVHEVEIRGVADTYDELEEKLRILGQKSFAFSSDTDVSLKERGLLEREKYKCRTVKNNAAEMSQLFEDARQSLKKQKSSSRVQCKDAAIRKTLSKQQNGNDFMHKSDSEKSVSSADGSTTLFSVSPTTLQLNKTSKRRSTILNTSSETSPQLPQKKKKKVKGARREWMTMFRKQPRVNLFRCDRPLGDVVVPVGLVEYVGRVMGDNPDYRGLMRLLNERFFDGKLRGYTVWRTKGCKDAFGFTDFLRKKIMLQECLFSAELSRTVLVRVLVHEMCHAFVDVLLGNRWENQCHGANWKKEVLRLNTALGCNIEDDGDIDWVKLRKMGLDKLYICDRCGKQSIRMIKRPPDAKFFSWVPRHAERCGGSFVLALIVGAGTCRPWLAVLTSSWTVGTYELFLIVYQKYFKVFHPNE